MAESFFAVCPRGVEELLAAELDALGAASVKPAAGGVLFSGEMPVAYAANLHSRIASRVLLRVAGGPYRSETDVYELARAVAWEREFDVHQSLRVDVTATRSPLRSLQFATLRVKDAIADRARDRTGARPSVDRAHPDVQVLAHLEASTAHLYIDLSGEALFKRGWRADKGEAPVKENLAAALLWLSGWQPGMPLLDPFCGSGTIAIEAACITTRRAPGLERSFAFERLKRHDDAAWQSMRRQAHEAIDDDAPMNIAGRDISTRVIELACANARRAGLLRVLERGGLRFEAMDARKGEPTAAAGIVVSNPPYGEQSNPKSASVASMMCDLAAQLKRAFSGWSAWLLSADRDLPRQMRLKESRKIVLFNGPIECRFFRFDMVAGSMRRKPSAAD